MNCNVCHRPAEDHADGLMCCPFCGQSPLLIDPILRLVKCDDCSFILSSAMWNRRASGWIPCAERMPGNWQYVLVASEGDVSMGYVVEGQWATPQPMTVTYWMPKPAPPKGEE